MRVISYTRTSTMKQDISLEAQEENIRAFCKIKGLEVSEVISDADEFSGTLDRPGMQRILQMVEAKEVDAVAIYRLDRMTRSVRDAINLVDLFNRKGVTFISVMESLDTKTPMGMFFVQMIAAIAELERRTICERTRVALQHIKSTGCPAGPAPYGYRAQERPEVTVDGRKVKQRMPLVEDEQEQQTISVILADRAAKVPYRMIADRLNAAGYRTRTGGKWTHTAMARIIRANTKAA
jgi:site-specific DNA recombinase